MTSHTQRRARFVPVDLWVLVAIAVLVLSLLRGWSQADFSEADGPFQLPIHIPGLPSAADLGRLNWGWLLLGCAAIALTGCCWPRAEVRARLLSSAGVLLLVTALGFVVLTTVNGGEHLTRLVTDYNDRLAFSKLMGYNVLRSHVTSLGPIPLSSTASVVVSSLRSGWFLCLLSAGLLLWRSSITRPTAVAMPAGPLRARRMTGLPLWAAGAVVVWALVAGTVATVELNRADTARQSGNYRAAAASAQRAVAVDAGVLDLPDQANRVGQAQLAAGRTDTPQAQLALNRQQVTSGHGLQALKTLAAATSRWPHSAAVAMELATQAAAYVTAHNDPATVRAIVPSSALTPILQLLFAKRELDLGDNPNAISDAIGVAQGTQDRDLLSAALTLQAVALQRSGQDVQGRAMLVAAVSMDHDSVNAMARSLSTGLYTTVQP